MNRSRKDVTMMVAMGALLLFAVFNFVFKPQRADLASAQSQRLGVEQKISDAQLLLQTPTSTVVTSQGTGAPAQAIPPDPAIASLLRQLHALADQTGLTLESISPATLAANPDGPGGSIQISITGSGAHAASQAFLAGLGSLERLAVVNQIGIDVQPQIDHSRQMDRVQLSVRVYTLISPVTAAITTTTTKP